MPRKITIITPSLNSLNLLKETAYSILNQKALLVKDVELEYIIQDGGSTDGTSEWIDSLQHPCIRYSSEKDKGMYEALAKGLSITTGDVIGYLNCGDYLSPYAFDIISRVFLDVKIRWFTGYNTWYNHDGYMISANLPFRYRRGLIRKGIYHKFNLFIQQESTFWRQDLMPELDLEKSFPHTVWPAIILYGHHLRKSLNCILQRLMLEGFDTTGGNYPRKKKNIKRNWIR
ncbi:MAG: glycosyltransferase [Deltaproteobacteria bacterium]